MARCSRLRLLPVLALAAVGAAPAPASPAAGRFVVAGIMIGMSLPQAVTAMRETFGLEGLTDVHIMTAFSHPGAGGKVTRLAIAQQASIQASGSTYYREDGFKLRLAGPPSAPVVTAVTRDYLSPVGLDRAVILRNLIRKYGAPTSSIVPEASVPTGTAQLLWVITPGGGLAGGGVQYSTDLRCGTALTEYSDYFDNALGNDADLARILKTQRGGGCGLVLNVDVSYDAIHYQLYDTAAAAAALAPGAAVKIMGSKAAPVAAVLRY